MSPTPLRRLGRRLLPHPWLSLVLTLVWLLLVESLSVGQILLAALLGWGIARLTRAWWPETPRLRRPWTLARFAALVLYDIALANLTVAWIVLSRPRRVRPAFVQIPLDLKSDLAIGLFANTVSLTPGTLSAWLSADRRTLVVHALDSESPERLAAALKARYEAPLMEVFESC